MSKKKKAIVITLAVLTLCLTAVYVGYLQAPRAYLSEKYGVDKSEFHAVFLSPKTHKKKVSFFLDTEEYDYWIPTQWTYRYNNRCFHIEYYDGHYADDYQLDDLWRWTTEYLKENVDENICGVQLYEQDIFVSSKNKYNHFGTHGDVFLYDKVWSEKDIPLFLTLHKGVQIYYKVDNINDYLFEIQAGFRTNDYYNELVNSLEEKTSTLLKTKMTVGLYIIESHEQLEYRRINTFNKNSLLNYSSTYGTDINKEIENESIICRNKIFHKH